MKRIILLITALAAGTAAAYAEDAAVLPAGTLRVDADAAVGFVREGWDGNSRKVDAPDAVILGTALGVGYGFTHWFTTVLDWSPGVTDTDLVDIDIGNDGDGAAEIYEGLSDFSLKAQLQLIGNNAPFASDRFRMRVSPGIVIPFPGITASAQSTKRTRTLVSCSNTVDSASPPSAAWRTVSPRSDKARPCGSGLELSLLH